MNRFALRSEIRLSSHLAWRDLRARYAQTVLGPWWSMINLAVVLLGSSVAVALISGTSPGDQAPRIAVGLAIWTLVSSTLSEASTLFESERGMMLNTTISELAVVSQLLLRNNIVFLHNAIVIVVTFLLSGRALSIQLLVLFPLIALTSVSLLLPVLLVARWSLFVGDLKIFLPAIVQFSFFLTPVLWSPPETGLAARLTLFNPFSWPLEFARILIFENRADYAHLTLLILSGLGGLAILFSLSSKFRSVRKYL